MWTRLWRFFSRKQAGEEVTQPVDPTFKELQAVKKMLRKQTALLEEMREEWVDYTAKELQQDLQPLMAFADAFFYLDQSIWREECLSPQRTEALNMVWNRLDGLLAATEVEMVREKAVPFDARLHEAVENTSGGDGRLEILRILQPGYLYRDRVVKTAKVIVGSTESGESFQQGVNE